ncbi:MAG: hypothetical protein RIQ56_844 [Candidatus Parcubacteria bacterium]|jgi:uncharacterized protein
MRAAALASLFVAGVFYATPAFAYVSPGQPSGYVNDFARVLSGETVASLNTSLSTFQTETSNQIAVVLVPNLGGDYIENYAVKLFEEWGIGTKSRDNGVLLLLAIEDRKLRIEVGYGLEGALPDSVAQSIINNEMTPLLKQGNYDGAVVAGVEGIKKATAGEYVGEPDVLDLFKNSESFIELLVVLPLILVSWLGAILGRSKSWWLGGILGAGVGAGIWFFWPLAILGGFLLTAVLLGVGLLFDYIVSHAFHNAQARGMRAPWWAGGGGMGGHGGGFGGFGGGSSGGGGASGSW